MKKCNGKVENQNIVNNINIKSISANLNIQKEQFKERVQRHTGSAWCICAGEYLLNSSNPDLTKILRAQLGATLGPLWVESCTEQSCYNNSLRSMAGRRIKMLTGETLQYPPASATFSIVQRAAPSKPI